MKRVELHLAMSISKVAPDGNSTNQANSGQEYRVTPFELFFDIVFAFALSQLSHHLLHHLTWHGVAETLVMLLAVFTAWFVTSWSATIVHADQSRTRWLVLTVMVLGLFMNSPVTVAFTTSGWAFAVPMLVIMLGRTVWMLVYAPNPVFKEHYVRTLLWVIATTPLWIAGAAVNHEYRLTWWALAAGIDQIGRWLAHPIPGRKLHSEHVPFSADHMLERCLLFLIIALGETVVATGIAMVEAPFGLMTVATGTVAMIVAIALWALSFGRSYKLTLQHLEQTSNPILTSRRSVDTLTIMVAGLVAVAVASEAVTTHPQGRTPVSLSLLLAGGPILFLAGQGWYLRAVPHVWSKLHFIGVGVLVLVGIGTLFVPAYAALIIVAISLTTLAVVDQK